MSNTGQSSNDESSQTPIILEVLDAGRLLRLDEAAQISELRRELDELRKTTPARETHADPARATWGVSVNQLFKLVLHRRHLLPAAVLLLGAASLDLVKLDGGKLGALVLVLIVAMLDRLRSIVRTLLDAGRARRIDRDPPPSAPAAAVGGRPPRVPMSAAPTPPVYIEESDPNVRRAVALAQLKQRWSGGEEADRALPRKRPLRISEWALESSAESEAVVDLNSRRKACSNEAIAAQNAGERPKRAA